MDIEWLEKNITRIGVIATAGTAIVGGVWKAATRPFSERIAKLEAKVEELEAEKEALQERLIKRVEDDARARDELRDRLDVIRRGLETRRSTPPSGTRIPARSDESTSSSPPLLPPATPQRSKSS